MSLTKLFEKSWAPVLTAAIATLVLFVAKIETVFTLNYDAILYLQVADRYLSHGFLSAQHLYTWPFYSLSIAAFSHLLGISLLSSAFTLNALFQIMISVAFIGIVKRLGGNLLVQWFAVAVIIFYPQLNDYRTYIIRDFGFWAFYLTAFYCFLHYFQSMRWFDAILGGIAMTIAGFFRVEGFVFLYMLPFATWFLSQYSWRQRTIAFGLMSVVGLVMLSMLMVWLCLPNHDVNQLGRFAQIPLVLRHGVFYVEANLTASILRMQTYVLSPQAQNAAPFIFITGLLGFYLFKLVKVFGVICTFLWGYGVWRRSLALGQTEKVLLWSFGIINLAITLYFLATSSFISSRYLLALLFILLLWAPFALAELYQRCRQKRGHCWLLLLILAYLLLTAGAKFVHLGGASKGYLINSGQWLARNAPRDFKLYTNNVQVLYYAKGTDFTWATNFDDDLTKFNNGEWRDYDYLAVRYHRDSKPTQAEVALQTDLVPVKSFANTVGDKVVIYKVNHHLPAVHSD